MGRRCILKIVPPSPEVVAALDLESEDNGGHANIDLVTEPIMECTAKLHSMLERFQAGLFQTASSNVIGALSTMQALLADLQEISLEPLTSSCFDTDAIGLALHKLINDVMKRRNELLSAVFIVRLQQALTPVPLYGPHLRLPGYPMQARSAKLLTVLTWKQR